MISVDNRKLVELVGVNKSFGGVTAANDVSFDVSQGEVVGLIGPNGAGKTTQLNLISGIYKVDSGSILFDGTDITAYPAYKRARLGIARTFQAPRYSHRSRLKNNMLLGNDLANGVDYWRSFCGRCKTDFYSDYENLIGILGFNVDLNAKISEIPYGQQKLLEIVRALLGHPRFMMIDEPAAGLNAQEGDIINDLIKYATETLDIGVLLIEHQMDIVMNICHKIVVLNFGNIIALGKPEEVSTDSKVIEAYLGRPFHVKN